MTQGLNEFEKEEKSKLRLLRTKIAVGLTASIFLLTSAWCTLFPKSNDKQNGKNEKNPEESSFSTQNTEATTVGSKDKDIIDDQSGLQNKIQVIGYWTKAGLKYKAICFTSRVTGRILTLRDDIVNKWVDDGESPSMLTDLEPGKYFVIDSVSGEKIANFDIPLSMEEPEFLDLFIKGSGMRTVEWKRDFAITEGGSSRYIGRVVTTWDGKELKYWKGELNPYGGYETYTLFDSKPFSPNDYIRQGLSFPACPDYTIDVQDRAGNIIYIFTEEYSTQLDVNPLTGALVIASEEVVNNDTGEKTSIDYSNNSSSLLKDEDCLARYEKFFNKDTGLTPSDDNGIMLLDEVSYYDRDTGDYLGTVQIFGGHASGQVYSLRGSGIRVEYDPSLNDLANPGYWRLGTNVETDLRMILGGILNGHNYCTWEEMFGNDNSGEILPQSQKKPDPSEHEKGNPLVLKKLN